MSLVLLPILIILLLISRLIRLPRFSLQPSTFSLSHPPASSALLSISSIARWRCLRCWPSFASTSRGNGGPSRSSAHGSGSISLRACAKQSVPLCLKWVFIGILVARSGSTHVAFLTPPLLPPARFRGTSLLGRTLSLRQPRLPSSARVRSSRPGVHPIFDFSGVPAFPILNSDGTLLI